MSLRQLAALAGYQNLNKGCNRIQSFESGGKVAPDLFAKLTSLLEVSPDEVRRLCANQPTERQLTSSVSI
jgi:hypothetical protein